MHRVSQSCKPCRRFLRPLSLHTYNASIFLEDRHKHTHALSALGYSLMLGPPEQTLIASMVFTTCSMSESVVPLALTSMEAGLNDKATQVNSPFLLYLLGRLRTQIILNWS